MGKKWNGALTKRLRMVNPNGLVFAAGLLGLVASTFSLKHLAAICFFFLVTNIYELLRIRYDKFLAVAILFQILIVQSSAIYIFGQFGFAGTSTNVKLIGYVSILGVYFVLGKNLSTSSSIQTTASAALGFILLICINAIPSWRVIQFLGFGYDNYGHINVIRKILVDHKFFYNELNPTAIPSFASNAPMGGQALTSFIGEMIGVNGSDFEDSLKFYLFAVALLVVLFVWISVAIATLHLVGIWTKVLSSILISAILFFTYVSHIWFSGYFASNLSTLLVLIGVAVLISNTNTSQRFIVLISLIGTSVYIYPLYAIFMFAIAAVILSSKNELMRQIRSTPTLKTRIGLIVFLSYFVSIASLSVYSMTNGFDSGHFLAPGGIEPMPLATVMFIFGISLMLLNGKGAFGSLFDPASRAVIAMNFFATCGVIYAFSKLSVPGEKWNVPYYPTKLAISALIITLIFLTRYLFEFENSQHKFMKFLDTRKLVIILTFIALFVVSSHKWPFSGGYMGSTSGVIESIRSSRSEVVDGRVIEASMQLVEQFKGPILYLSDAHESELNTRWINSLQFEWIDSNWGAWMESRRLIDEDKLVEAADIINPKFYLIIDGYTKYNDNPHVFKIFQNICVIDAARDFNCQEI